MNRHATLLLFLLLAITAFAHARDREMTQHATGTFEVSITQEAEDAGAVGGVSTSHLGLSKRFLGRLDNTATGTMIAAGVPKPGVAAVYVVIDQFTGKLNDRSGGIILVYRGTMKKGGSANLQFIIASSIAALGNLKASQVVSAFA